MPPSEDTRGQNGMMVKVAKMGQRVQELFLPVEDRKGNDVDVTVADALRKAGYTVGKTQELRLNGEPSKQDVTLSDGDKITIVPKIGLGQ